MRLSQHFTDIEFRCRHCNKLPDQPFGSIRAWVLGIKKSQKTLDDLKAAAQKFDMNLDQHKVSPDLLIKLERLRDFIGEPIRITSGYRCPVHNKAIGGAKNSQHLKGTAADIVVKGMTPAEVKVEAEKIFGYKSGIGLYAGFCHVDVRGWHARW